MKLIDKVNEMKKEVAIKTNYAQKLEIILGNIQIILLLLFLFLINKFIIKQFGLMGEISVCVGSLVIIGTIIGWFASKIRLDEDSINKWFESLPSESINVKEVDELILDNWDKPREQVLLKRYEITNKGDEKLISFIHNDTNYNIPLNHIKYDEGEKRIEFYVSDNDYTVNLYKGAWFDIHVYNV